MSNSILQRTSSASVCLMYRCPQFLRVVGGKINSVVVVCHKNKHILVVIIVRLVEPGSLSFSSAAHDDRQQKLDEPC
jgi:hypothetical protein